MHFKIKVREGDQMSMWYGYSYRDFTTRGYICYIAPFHIPIRWVRSFWIWLIMPMRPDYSTRIYELGLQKGFEKGQKLTEEKFKQLGGIYKKIYDDLLENFK